MPVQPPTRFLSTYVYIDAGYIIEHLKRARYRTDFDPRVLATFVDAGMAGSYWVYDVVRIYYYDAALEASDPDFEAQRDRLVRLQTLDYVFVRTGWVTGKRRRQRAVDVQLAVDALEAARTGTIQAIALFAGDADFTPLAEAVHRAGTRFLVVAWKDSLSQELANAADLVIALTHPKNLGTDVLAP